MEDNYINELDMEFKKSRWLRGGTGGKENRDMRDVRDVSGSSHSSDSHGVYSAYSNIGATTVFSPLSCENTSDYQQMESSRRRDRSSSKLREERSPSDQSSPKSAFENAHKSIREMAHFRTKSDITPTATNNTKPSKTFSLSRSKSIASARDKWKISSSYGLLPFLSRDSSKSNLNESGERSSQENMNREIEGLQAKYKSESQERQRLERKMEKIDEVYELRDQQKHMLGGSSESLSLMYSSLARKYEARKEECDKLARAHTEAVTQAEQYQDQLNQYKSSYENMVNERNKYKQQCTQAIRQWDQALAEKNHMKTELDQAMNIRVKASKDIKRLTEERNSALHEYSVIMSERDLVHKEMEKLQDEIQSNSAKSKKIELLQIEIRAALTDRDNAMKEVHELKRKLDDKENMNPSVDNKVIYDEINQLKKQKQELEEKLKNSFIEADVAKGRRDWAFAERDKIMLASEGVQALCDKLRKERDKAMTDLIDIMKELNDIKEQKMLGAQNVRNEQKLLSNEKGNPNLRTHQITQKLDSAKSHGIDLGEGIFVRSLESCSVFAKNNSIKVGDRILKINNTDTTDGNLNLAKNALDKSEYLTLTIETTKDPPAKGLTRKESDDKRTDFVSKMIQRSESDSRPGPTVSKLFTSSERVYSLSNTPTQSKESKKPWTHFKENVKEKLDLVKGRRQSTEQGDDEDVGRDRGERVKSGEIRDVETMLRNIQTQGQGRKCSESETDSIDAKYPLRNLDSKILEIKQNFAAPQTPTVNSNRSKFLQRIPNPQDVVQSHYLQVQSRIQDSLKKQNNIYGKEDYFLASSASETSLNESLKSGNLDEHEVICPTETDKSAVEEAASKVGGKPQTNTNVTSPKRTSPFPHLKMADSQYHGAFHYPQSNIYNLYTGQTGYRQMGITAPPSIEGYEGFSSLPPEASGLPPLYSALAPPPGHKRLSLASLGRTPLSPAADSEFPASYVSDKASPSPGDIRQFHIDKSGEQLGIKIEEVSIQSEVAGIFVSRVSADSLASRVGLKVGDQLLEVCGINLRTAKYTQAAHVLHRAGKSVDIKVQYNPDKFEQGYNSNSAESIYGYTRAASPSPVYGLTSELASPQAPKYKSTPIRSESQSDMQGLANSSLSPDGRMTLPKSKSSTLKSALNMDLVQHYKVSGDDQNYLRPGRSEDDFSKFNQNRCSPRLLRPVLHRTGVLGVRLVGGNAVGIFIHSVESGSPASDVGIQRGDQVLEYNGVDLRTASAEQAAYELAQPVEHNVAILVQYNPDLYSEIKDVAGDSYYIRAMFDRPVADLSNSDNFSQQLYFSKDDLLWVDNTIYNGVPGNWSAWILDKDGSKIKWGLIPSKYKVEESLRKKNRGKSFSDGVYEFSNSTRRSFLKKIKGSEPGTRDTPSLAPGSGEEERGQCRELAVYSDLVSLASSSHMEASTLTRTGSSHLLSYLRLEKRESNFVRPVLILGPFAQSIIEKLSSDHPSKFVQCLPEYMNSDLKAVEKGVTDDIFIDFKRRGSHFECTTYRSVRDIIANNQHSFIDVNISAVEKLRQNQIYPIVILIKFKSAKHLKEVSLWDSRSGYPQDPPNIKDAKNLHEHSLKLEEDYKHLISDVVQAGTNIMLLSAQVVAKIDLEQKRPIWIPSGTIW